MSNNVRIEFPNSQLPLAVIVANTNWNEPPRMRHHIAYQLIRRFNVLFVEFFPNVLNDNCQFTLVNERLGILKPEVKFNIHDSVYINIPLVHSLINHCYAKNIGDLIESTNASDVYLFNFSWNFSSIFKLPIFKLKIYLCNDEFPLMFSKGKFSLFRCYQSFLFQKYENSGARLASFCYTPHVALKNKLITVNCDVRLLLHAFNEIKQLSNTDLELSKRTFNNPSLKLGYAGFIHYRINKHVIKELLDNENNHVFLIGPLDPNFDIEYVCHYPNLTLTGALSENDMLNKLSEMDVLIIPYIIDLPEVKVLTTVSKLFQYISTLKPIVISDMPNFIEFPEGVIYKVTESDSFDKIVNIANKQNSDLYRKLRLEILLANTWQSRGDQIFSDIENFNN